LTILRHGYEDRRKSPVDASLASMPKLALLGLAETAVIEYTHRVERPLVNSGCHRVFDRVVINLAPAALRSKTFPAQVHPAAAMNPCRCWYRSSFCKLFAA